MTSHAELLTFVIRWLPFGKAPLEDVFVTFGLTNGQFRDRLAEAVAHERRHISPSTAAAIVTTYCLKIPNQNQTNSSSSAFP